MQVDVTTYFMALMTAADKIHICSVRQLMFKPVSLNLHPSYNNQRQHVLGPLDEVTQNLSRAISNTFGICEYLSPPLSNLTGSIPLIFCSACDFLSAEVTVYDEFRDMGK